MIEWCPEVNINNQETREYGDKSHKIEILPLQNRKAHSKKDLQFYLQHWQIKTRSNKKNPLLCKTLAKASMS